MGIPEEIREYLRYIAESIRAVMPVKAIYLFGSYADGSFRENKSDLDIYVITSDKTKRQHEWGVTARTSFKRKIRIPIDLVVNYDDDFEVRSKRTYTLEYQVITKGVIITNE